MTTDEARIITVPKIADPRGNLSVAEELKEIPFKIARVYWLYEVPEGGERGGHAHKECLEILFALHGSFTVTLDNGKGDKETFHLSRPDQGLLINTGIWRTLQDFSSDAVCMVLASELYDEDDYIYEYSDFREYAKD